MHALGYRYNWCPASFGTFKWNVATSNCEWLNFDKISKLQADSLRSVKDLSLLKRYPKPINLSDSNEATKGGSSEISYQIKYAALKTKKTADALIDWQQNRRSCDTFLCLQASPLPNTELAEHLQRCHLAPHIKETQHSDSVKPVAYVVVSKKITRV